MTTLPRLAAEHLRHFEDRGADTSLPYAEMMASRAAAEVLRAVVRGELVPTTARDGSHPRGS